MVDYIIFGYLVTEGFEYDTMKKVSSIVPYEVFVSVFGCQ